MALNLNTPTFGPVVFAKNPVLFKLRSLDGSFNSYAAQGAKSKLSAGAGSKFATAGTLSITYDEPDGTTETVVFTATATYTAEDEIPDSSFGGSISQYWEALKNKVANHHRIAPFFTAQRTGPLGGNTLTLKARSSDPDWSITMTNTEGFTITDTAATVDSTPVNYSVLLEVYFERTYKAGDYVLAAQLKNQPDVDGYTQFDISSILEAECTAGLVSPVVPTRDSADTMPADNLRRYYIRYTEEYGTPIVSQEWQYDSVRVCMNGGVSQTIYAQGDFLTGLNIDDCFLTWMPDGRKIGLDQPEWLAWYNWDVEARSVFIQMQWYAIADNHASTASGHFTALPTDPHEVALLPANPTLLGIPSNAWKYRVRVVYNDGEAYQPLSQWRNYYIDRDYYHSERYVQYLNGFGVPDCWRCTGVWGKKISIERTIAERPLLPGFNEFATDSFQFRGLWDQELNYNTGFMTRGEADVLQEMLVSGEVYDVSEDGYIPLRLTSNAFPVTDTDEDLHAYRFTAQPRLTARNYSKKKLNNLQSGAWQEPGGEAWFDAVLTPWELP